MTEDFGSRDGQRDDKTGPSPFADMIEATRLTGLGRLEEATALIQRSLGGQKAPPADPPAAPQSTLRLQGCGKRNAGLYGPPPRR
ncbi:hypothetical protein [Methylobacterium oryzae]|uniref:hypothetical protein n=1 Tax=Methylobacterium oryzae TaxID=334852 RepID=UPI003AF8E795